MQSVAQGRVWSGLRAKEKGLVDAIGGVQTAIALAKEAVGMKANDRVKVIEVSKASVSPLALISGGGASVANLFLLLAQYLTLFMSFVQKDAGASGAFRHAEIFGTTVANGSSSGAHGVWNNDHLIRGVSAGAVMAQLPEVQVDGVGSLMALANEGSGEQPGFTMPFNPFGANDDALFQ